MKRPLLFLLPLLLLSGSLPAAAGPSIQGFKFFAESQALTRAAPATSSTDGISLVNVKSWRLIVCAQAAAAITGGTMILWVQASDGLWADTPRAVTTFTFTSTGQRCQSFGEFDVGVRTGRFLPATSSVTVSAGTAVSVRLEYTVL